MHWHNCLWIQVFHTKLRTVQSAQAQVLRNPFIFDGNWRTSMYETRSRNSLSCMRLMWSKISATASGMIPGSEAVPRMVCVFPLDVCPYANTVPLKPPTTWERQSCLYLLLVFKTLTAKSAEAFSYDIIAFAVLSRARYKRLV